MKAGASIARIAFTVEAFEAEETQCTHGGFRLLARVPILRLEIAENFARERDNELGGNQVRIVAFEAARDGDEQAMTAGLRSHPA